MDGSTKLRIQLTTLAFSLVHLSRASELLLMVSYWSHQQIPTIRVLEQIFGIKIPTSSRSIKFHSNRFHLVETGKLRKYYG